jgi:glycosyltransferase involved in cell wall biosynthesis
MVRPVCVTPTPGSVASTRPSQDVPPPCSGRTVLVHDYLLVMRGAERTFAAMSDCWPDAPVHSLLYDEGGTQGRFAARDVHTSALQHLHLDQGNFRRFLPLMPVAASAMHLPPADLVVSSSSAFAHGVHKPEGAFHVCYCHSPFRYAWFEQARALAEVPRATRPLLAAFLHLLRQWDRHASGEVDLYIANSSITQERIHDVYGRDAPIVYPPVDTSRFAPGDPEDWFLVVCELVRHKRVDVVLQAAARAGVPVRVVGTGPDLERLRGLAGPTVEFLGRVGDCELAGLYARARAVVVANVEEFGIVSVEAQAAGRPVLAAAAGGNTETVVEGRTGVFFPVDDVDSLAEAMRQVDFDQFDVEQLTSHAELFSESSFRRRLREEITWAT